MRRWLILNGILIGFVVVLLWQIVATWARSLPPVEMTAHPAPPAVAPGPHEHGRRGGPGKAGAPVQLEPSMLVKAIADKDLFDPSRQPPPPEEKKGEAGGTVALPPPTITVVGIRIVGRDREVFVTDTAQNNQQRRLRVGDQVSGYTVKSVDPTGLTLSSPAGELVSMPLTIEKKAGVPRAVRPGQPGGQLTASPAAGVQGASTAAGIPVKAGQPGVPPAPVPLPVPGAAPAVAPQPNQNPQAQLPADVRQKLEQLKQKEGNGRLGRKPPR